MDRRAMLVGAAMGTMVAFGVVGMAGAHWADHPMGPGMMGPGMGPYPGCSWGDHDMGPGMGGPPQGHASGPHMGQYPGLCGPDDEWWGD